MSKKINYLDTQRFSTNRTSFLRDVRPLSVIFSEGIKRPDTAVMLLFGMAACSFVFPTICDPLLLIGCGYTYFFMKRVKADLPYKLPAQSKMKDPNENSGGPTDAQGILYYGNSMDGGGEVWFSNNDARTHFLILGTTGSGKTEALLSMSSNAMTWGSGFLYCDGKGDTSLWGKIYSLARRFGRDDDVLVLNFMTGNASGRGESNTTNPFSQGSFAALTEMLVSLMDDPGKEGDMWKGRAISLLSAILMALCELRDRGRLLLDIKALRDYLGLAKIIDLYLDKHGTFDISAKTRTSLKAYLDSLPGFDWNEARAGRPQPGTANDQHGYLYMQFTRILGSLGDVYGYIFDSELGDVDFFDVVINRRILLVLLPALEKSEDELANIGKIIVASLKGMMAATLGSKIEGDWSNVISSKPTNAPSPFMSILDEVGYYTVPGMAVMAAQARSLGFSLVFAAQDVSAMKKRSEKEAESIIANCNIKTFMKIEDPENTNKLFDASAGTFYAAEVSGFTMNSGSTFNNYMDIRNASVRERRRSEFIDLRELGPGQGYVFFGGKMTRLNMYYANPPSAKRLRYNRFIPVRAPDPAMTGAGNVEPVLSRLNDPEFIAANFEAPSVAQGELGLVIQVLNQAIADKKSLFNASCAAIGAIIHTINTGQPLSGHSGNKRDVGAVAYMPEPRGERQNSKQLETAAKQKQAKQKPSPDIVGAALEAALTKICGPDANDIVLSIRQSQQAWINDDESIEEGFVTIRDALTKAMGYPNETTAKLTKNDQIMTIMDDVIALFEDQPENVT
jgi:intracellular multiplication protein IcmO